MDCFQRKRKIAYHKQFGTNRIEYQRECVEEKTEISLAWETVEDAGGKIGIRFWLWICGDEKWPGRIRLNRNYRGKESR